MRYELDNLILEALNHPETGRDFFDGIRREMYDLLRASASHPQGLLTPDELSFPPERYAYAKMLTCAGLLEQKGDEMTPIHYTITDKGREVFERQFTP